MHVRWNVQLLEELVLQAPHRDRAVHVHTTCAFVRAAYLNCGSHGSRGERRGSPRCSTAAMHAGSSGRLRSMGGPNVWTCLVKLLGPSRAGDIIRWLCGCGQIYGLQRGKGCVLVYEIFLFQCGDGCLQLFYFNYSYGRAKQESCLLPCIARTRPAAPPGVQGSGAIPDQR